MFTSQLQPLWEAEQLYRRSLNAKESQLGSGHPSTLISVFNLADLLEAKGSFMEAGRFASVMIT